MYCLHLSSRPCQERDGKITVLCGHKVNTKLNIYPHAKLLPLKL